MKIFISWSGTRSKFIADALREWLPNVLQSLNPFCSTQDIASGSRGLIKIANELEEASVGIVCLTPENRLKPWILFEAGALSKLKEGYVCTLLHDLEPSNVEPPLGQFQHSRADENGFATLVRDINDLCGVTKLPAERMNKAIATWWPQLRERIANVPPRPEGEPVEETRTKEDKLDEILEILRRGGASQLRRVSLQVASAEELDLEKKLMRSYLAYCKAGKNLPNELRMRMLDVGLLERGDYGGVGISNYGNVVAKVITAEDSLGINVTPVLRPGDDPMMT